MNLTSQGIDNAEEFVTQELRSYDRVCAKPLARNDRFYSNKNWELDSKFQKKKKNFCLKASEVDQELECEMHQTKYKVMIGCDMDWPP
jgi:hypothetical protein